MKMVNPVNAVGVFSWENQAGQYPESGSGIQYFRAITENGSSGNQLSIK